MRTHVHMDRLVQLLREIDEHELARTRTLTGPETWDGPRADAVREDLHRLHRVILDALELAHRHRTSHESSTRDQIRFDPWDF